MKLPSFILTFKGKQLDGFSIENDSLYVLRIDGQLNTTWHNSLQFNGYIANIIRSDQNYYLYGSYNNLITPSGLSHNLDNRYNAFVYSISSLGEWGALKCFETPFSYFPLRVSKVDSHTVELNCTMETNANKLIQNKSQQLGEPFYLVTSFNGDIIMQYEP